MTEFVTLKVFLKPSLESIRILWSLSKTATKLYNIALEQKILFYNQKKSYLKYELQAKELKKLKKEFPEFNLLYSKVSQNVLRKLDDNFKSFFSNKNGNSNGNGRPRPPFFKSYKNFFTLRYDQSSFSIDFKNKILKITYNKEEKLEIPFVPLSNLRPKVSCVEIYQDKLTKDFYASFVGKIETPEWRGNNLLFVGDPGVQNLLTGFEVPILEKEEETNAFVFLSKRIRDIYKYFDKQIDKLKSKRGKLKRGSKRWKHLNFVIKKLWRKRGIQVKQALHTLSKYFRRITKANLVLIGDWTTSLAEKKKSKKINRQVQNNTPLSKFLQFVSYKLKRDGRYMIKLEEVGTTVSCSKCLRPQKMPPWKREFK